MENNKLDDWVTCMVCGAVNKADWRHTQDDCVEELQAVRAKLEAQVADLTLEVEQLREERDAHAQMPAKMPRTLE